MVGGLCRKGIKRCTICGRSISECNFQTDHRRWKAFVKAATLEKQWADERLKWFLTPQAFIFAAFGVTLGDKIDQNFAVYLRYVLCFVGIAFSVIPLYGVLAACKMHEVWMLDIVYIYDKYKNSRHKRDFTFGICVSDTTCVDTRSIFCDGLWSKIWGSNWEPASVARTAALLIPSVLCLAWLFLLVLSFLFGAGQVQRVYVVLCQYI